MVMEVHQLRYFVAVADEGSFTRAAEALRVSQSGVSTQIQLLERELGLRLIDRSERRIKLTGAGEVVLPRARAALAAIAGVRAAADEVLGLIRGTVRLGAVTGLTWPALFDALADVHDEHPGLDVRLIEGASEDLTELVARGELDAAVIAWSGPPRRDLRYLTVLEEELVAVVSPDHPWSSKRSVDATELGSQDIIALVRGTGARSGLDGFLAQASIVATPRWEVVNPVSVLLLAERGLGVGILSVTSAQRPDLVRIPLRGNAIRSSLGVVWRPRPQPSVAAHTVLAALRARTTPPTANEPGPASDNV